MYLRMMKGEEEASGRKEWKEAAAAAFVACIELDSCLAFLVICSIVAWAVTNEYFLVTDCFSGLLFIGLRYPQICFKPLLNDRAQTFPRAPLPLHACVWSIIVFPTDGLRN